MGILGLEFNVELGIAAVTKRQATRIAEVMEAYAGINAAAPHGSPYLPNPLEEAEEREGTRVADRRITVFLHAGNPQIASERAAEICTKLKASLRYEAYVVGVYEMTDVRP